MHDETAENGALWDDMQTDGDAVPSFDLTPEIPELAAPPVSPAKPVGPTGLNGPAAHAAHDAHASSAQSAARQPGQASAEMPNVQRVQFMQFDEARSAHATSNLDLLMDVPLPVIVELGRTTMLVRDIMALGPGSVIELEKAAGENVDILVNGRLIARGEVVVIEENFGVRIVEFVGNPEKAVQ